MFAALLKPQLRALAHRFLADLIATRRRSRRPPPQRHSFSTDPIVPHQIAKIHIAAAG